MRILVLGGTAWLGGYIVRTALERGHRVTALARGASAAAPDGADFIRADRDGPDAYADVLGETWDAVVDVSRQPGQVRRAAQALTRSSRSFVFVSSGSAYAEQSVPGQDESAARLQPLEGDVMTSMEVYGGAKVACEDHVLAAFGPSRCAILRAGLIGGPGDIFDRSGYWPLRFSRPATSDGRVLVPDAPDRPTQVIDVRDLATWVLFIAENGGHGSFNAVGETVPFARHLDIARAVAGHDGPLVPASEQWLTDHDVQPWMGDRSLPIWLPMSECGLNARDGGAARAAGLLTRPLEQTLADTLAWELTRPAGPIRRAGLSDADERDLLAQLEG